MAFDHLSSYRWMIIAGVAAGVLGTVVDASNLHSVDAERQLPWETIGSVAACKGKEDNDWCEYSPYGIEQNYLFSYTHDQQLKKNIKEVLEQRGLDSKDWTKMLVIKNKDNAALDLGFLHLPDIFDGKVTPNDFPLKVFLKETWKGKCGDGWCMGARGPLYDACDGRKKGDKCTYATLQVEKSRLEGVVPYDFEGTCEKSENGVSWCKLPTVREQQIEACLAKVVGKNCAYSTGEKGRDGLYKGLCMGGFGGQVLWCNGAKASLTDACEGKVRGDSCEVKGAKPWKGKCGYTDSSLQCMNGKTKPKPDPSRPVPAPAPSTGGGGSCPALEKEMKSMRMLLWKVAEKVGVKPPPKPKPPLPPKPSSRRRSKKNRRRSASRRRGAE